MSGLSQDGGLLLPLRERPFRLLASGRLLMYFANAMAPIVLAFAVLDLTGSKTDLGIVVGARSVANVVLLLAAGVVADRFSRTVILRGSACAAAAVQGAIAVSMLLDFTTIPLLILLSVLNGALSAVSMPASAALTPQTVPAKLLRPANALMRMAINLGMIIGAALGGVLVSVVGPGWGLACNAVAFLGAALCYFGLRIPAGKAEPTERPHPLRELREGWQEFTSRAWVWVVVAQFMVVNAVVAGGVYVLGPAVADETFGRTGWGVVLAAQMAGAVAGGFVAARSRAKHALRIGVAAVALEALPLAVLAEAPGVLLLTVTMFVNGVAMEQFGVAWEVSLQENVPEDRLARVYSYDALGSFIALPIGEMAAGPVADRAGVDTTLLAGAALVVVATGAALCSREVRQLATRVHKEPKEPEVAGA
ncbi:MFS transporter [Streptomyces somaliensis DSM 40738]|uniref:MFS transporter n=1 Tax=Streptomyces somaliensis (strain ATCC 33201 / DSM 40738 / JCM 12659 / KCTC 9044 / NCTC 11332 / NRRL B-12077 / IP 733) TaxID=1134445 RepID=A0AA44IBN7_STRE0|nr:MFS transporter [Streptomyces somaliensis]MCQ0024265.1 MFS transporter [Streptomyces somaliensis DSM 40738]NKY12876.1 MFS transporter [Streptomyces somaliensis DSM 40738]